MAERREMNKILVTGAVGQIGSELTVELRRRYGAENVVATGHRTKPSAVLCEGGPFEFIDVTHRETLDAVVRAYEIDTIYHMAAILSAVGEEKPHAAWNVNINGLHNVLEIARERDLTRVFCPSSIAVFGPETPRDDTPQETVLRPTTMYGVTKVAGELLCDYYVRRFGVDARGVRYPGIISSETLPGGGTTDYAVAIYYEAVARKRYTCFVRADTARLHQRHHRSDGGGRWPAQAPRRFQHGGDEFFGRRAGCRDQEAYPRVRVCVRTRLPTGNCRFVALLPGRQRGPPGVGLGTRIRSSGDDSGHAREAGQAPRRGPALSR